MNYMEGGIEFEAKNGRRLEYGLGHLFQPGEYRQAGVDRRVYLHDPFHQRWAGKKAGGFSPPPIPARVVPVNLAEVGGELICQKDAFLCAARGTSLSIAFSKKLGAGFFGGEGFILQKLSGDGLAFIHAGGTVTKRELRGETLYVDTGCLAAFSAGIEYDIALAGGLKSMFFGGEGMFLATLKGEGTVYLQSLPFSRMADRILAHAPSGGGKQKGED